MAVFLFMGTTVDNLTKDALPYLLPLSTIVASFWRIPYAKSETINA